MNIDRDLLTRFEEGLNPQDLSGSAVPAILLGYGEISAIFRIGDDDTLAYKRMPLFADRASAERYERQYHEYCHMLAEAGLTLPGSDTHIVEVPDRPVVLYIAQEGFPPERFVHRLLHQLDPKDFQALLERIVCEIQKVWTFNGARRPSLELAIDGQLSNWVLVGEGPEARLPFIDTSTPLYRKDGVEQLNPRLFLQAAPSYLRWILVWLFLDDVMNRYYDARKVYTDLAANLHKEQRPELIPAAVEEINRQFAAGVNPLTVKEIERYYKTDRLTWSTFLTLRRMDRWMTTRLFRRRYEFILPGRIRR